LREDALDGQALLDGAALSREPRRAFLGATFSVYFKDSLMGGLALHSFMEMIRKTYGKNYKSGEIDFMVSDQAMSLKSKALFDVLSCQHAACA